MKPNQYQITILSNSERVMRHRGDVLFSQQPRTVFHPHVWSKASFELLFLIILRPNDYNMVPFTGSWFLLRLPHTLKLCYILWATLNVCVWCLCLHTGGAGMGIMQDWSLFFSKSVTQSSWSSFTLSVAEPLNMFYAGVWSQHWWPNNMFCDLSGTFMVEKGLNIEKENMIPEFQSP